MMKMNIKKMLSTVNKFELLAIMFFIIQLILVVVLNFTRNSFRIDYDSTSAYSFPVEIWKSKSFLPDTWAFQTTLGLDTPAILVALLYGVFGDLFVAYSLANVVFTILYIVVFYRILKLINVSKTSAFLVLSIMLTPFTGEHLGYFTMLFSNSFFYVMRVLTPALILMIVLAIEKESTFKKELPWIFLTVLFCFLTAFSSGVLVLITGILPFLFYEIMETLFSNKLIRIKNKYTFLYIVCIFVSIFALFQQSRLVDFTQKPNEIYIHNIDSFADNIVDIIMGFFQFFGGLGDAEIFSITGIVILLKNFFTIMIFIIIIKYAWTWHKIKTTKLHIKLILSIVFINFFVLIFSRSIYQNEHMEYRYLTILILPVFLMLGNFIDEIISLPENKLLIKRTFLSLFSMIIVLISIVSYIYLFTRDNMYKKNIEPLMDIAVGLNPDTIIINSNRQTNPITPIMYARYSSTYYPKNDFLIVYPENGGYADEYGLSKSRFDVASRAENIALIIDPASFLELPEYIKSKYSLYHYDEVLNLEIHRATEDPRDFVSGLPTKNAQTSVDNPSTKNLLPSVIEINYNDGKYIIKKENIGFYFMLDNMPAKKGTYDIYVNYKSTTESAMGEESQFVLLYKDKENNILRYEKVELSDYTNQTAFFNVSFTKEEVMFTLYCYNVEGNEIEIEYIEYVRVN